MSIRDTNVVDWLGIAKDTGDVVLTLVDDEDWAEEQDHLELLQEKLNSYLAFIESGEIYGRLAADLGRAVARTVPVKVSILAKYPAPPRAQAFLEHAARTFTEAGLSLVHKVLPVGG